jgi:hypothetical protein
MTTEDIRLTIDAFADGEAVDPGRLSEALATIEGRDYLIDLLVLRGFVASDGASPRAALVASPTPTVPASRRWWPAAAAIAAFSVMGGYYVGQRSVPASDATGTAPRANVRVSAPEPTSVIKLDESADWTERVGAN